MQNWMSLVMILKSNEKDEIREISLNKFKMSIKRFFDFLQMEKY